MALLGNSKKYFPIQPSRASTKVRLFCFPYAGAGASVYESCQDMLPDDIEVLPVQLPGRENRILETPFFNIRPAVRTIAQILLPYLDTEFAFFGHCMGALISYELIREFRRKHNLVPNGLFVSAYHAPHLPLADKKIHLLTDNDLKEEIYLRGGILPEVLENTEMMEFLVPSLRADSALVETYVYEDEKPLSCPITVFGAEDDPNVAKNDLLEWNIHTSGTFASKFVTGGHLFLESNMTTIMNVVGGQLSSLES